MTSLHELIADMVTLADGELTGRIRLQKIVYLLDQLGLKSGAHYIYHHYGPYSENVADAISDAKFWGDLEEATDFRQSDGAPYSIFKVRGKRELTELGGLDLQRARSLLAKLKPINSTILELAATAHWLANVEKVSDWRSEIERRKAGKTTGGRLDRAVQLLDDLGLAPVCTHAFR